MIKFKEILLLELYEKKSFCTLINKLNSTISTISNKNWWKEVKSVYGAKACSQIPPIKEGAIFISESLKKAELFNNYFVSQSPSSSSNSAPDILVAIVTVP